MNSNDIVGFTTTIPVEILFAAGRRPCDLNNIFVTHPDPLHYVALAEKEGFPKSMCNWIKGIYGVVRESNIKTVVTVLEGDCSNTRALAEILTYRGVRTIPFSFPYDRDRESLEREINKFMATFGVDKQALRAIDERLTAVRQDLERIDRMTWMDRRVTGQENHLWQLCASDMEGDHEGYRRKAEAFIADVERREPFRGLPVGYVGVPPISPDLYEFVEENGCHVIYNEVQRQFSLPYFSGDMVDRYLNYTYPYGIFARLHDIREEIRRRNLKGIIHYVQAFCYRVIEDIILKETLGVPVITIEGDLPKRLDTRTKLRLEAFMEMLKARKRGED
ncbi:MAG: 2-hydroxyglutaryl-CoA dehydratase, D-component [Syntrophorhabdaceae bacterium PtaU1.Bin034]|nr:MAG: 2-hydroxyglutaryl-CoA dehydratase, D-component [Syntrophorhabdaceae bacterium PtaU1.Bin034]